MAGYAGYSQIHTVAHGQVARAAPSLWLPEQLWLPSSPMKIKVLGSRGVSRRPNNAPDRPLTTTWPTVLWEVPVLPLVYFAATPKGSLF